MGRGSSLALPVRGDGRAGCAAGGCARAIIVHPHYRHTLHLPPEPPTCWGDLPEELVATVVALLDMPSVCRLARVNSTLRRLCREQSVWARLCCARFGVPPERAPPCWHELYQWNHQLFLQVCREQQVVQPPPLHLPGLAPL